MSTEEENNSVCCSSRCWSVFSYVVAVAAAILIVWGLNGMLRHYTVKVEKENREARGKERKSERDKLAQAVAAENTYGWVDEKKGIVRVPVERGMSLILAEYKDGKTARKNLNDRLAKKTAKPPKAPEKPSDFE